MLRQFIQRHILNPKKVAGVKIHTGDNGNTVFNYVLLEQKSGQAVMTDKSEYDYSFDQLLQKLPRGIPVGLAVDGNSVLVKKSPSSNSDPTDVLPHIIPNIQIQNFTFQTIHLQDTGVFALIRTEILDEYIRQFDERGHHALSCNLAFLGVEQLLVAVPESFNPLCTARWEIVHAKGMITGFQLRKDPTSVSYLLNGTPVTDRHVLALTSALQSLLGTEPDLQNAPSLHLARKNYLYERVFRFGGILFLAVISVALLFNAFFFFEYTRKLEQQTITLAANQKQLVHLDSLQKLHHTKQQFLEGNSLMRPSLTAWYADQIGASRVEGIRLSELHIFPPEKANKTKEVEQHFQSGLIKIKGISRQSADLNRWLNILQSLEWVKEVKVLPYSENREGQGEFELEVRVNPE